MGTRGEEGEQTEEGKQERERETRPRLPFSLSFHASSLSVLESASTAARALLFAPSSSAGDTETRLQCLLSPKAVSAGRAGRMRAPMLLRSRRRHHRKLVRLRPTACASSLLPGPLHLPRQRQNTLRMSTRRKNKVTDYRREREKGGREKAGPPFWQLLRLS